MPSNGLPSQAILEGHTAAVTVVEFSTDGRFLASAASNGAVLVFSTSSWAPVCRFLDVSPVSVLVWHKKRRYLLFCGHQSGDLHVLTMSKSMKCTVVQTSTFAGCIHSISLSPTSSRIAIGHGNEIALTDVIPSPYRLKDNKEILPKPPAFPHGASKPGGPIAKSLHFMRKNRIVATYTAHGIVVWDADTLKVAAEIVPRTFPIGKSVVAANDNIMAVSNLINGVDWYSLSDLVFLSTTKLPAGAVFSPLSALAYIEDGVSVVLGDADGSGHILSRKKGVENLKHDGGSGIIQSVAFTPGVSGYPLIAAGTSGLHRRATVAIWGYAEKKPKSGISFVMIQRFTPAGLTCTRILINVALMCVCCACLTHFLAGERPTNNRN